MAVAVGTSVAMIVTISKEMGLPVGEGVSVEEVVSFELVETAVAVNVGSAVEDNAVATASVPTVATLSALPTTMPPDSADDAGI